MRVAYLVNQYPSVSHTFIRREIEALESLGVHVERFSIRPMDDAALPDLRDRQELHITQTLLPNGGTGLVPAMARVAKGRPSAFAKASALTVQIGKRSDRGLAFNVAYLAEACRLLEELERKQIDHVHAHFGTNSAAVAMLCRVLGGPSYSFTAHGPEEFDKPDLIALETKIQHAAFVVGVSSFGRSQLLRRCPVEQWPKIQVVRCGVGRNYLERAPTPVPTNSRVVCVGRLCEQKGQLLLVEAAAKLAREGRRFELVLVGDGPMRAQIEQLVSEHELGAQVRITGWASGEEVEREIEGARGLVLPSFAEGLPVVLMEALARGRPVVSTYIAGIPELVEDGACGYLVPAGSAHHVADALRKLLDADAETLARMGAEGAARVRAMHDVRLNAAQLREHFQRYAGGPSAH